MKELRHVPLSVWLCITALTNCEHFFSQNICTINQSLNGWMMCVRVNPHTAGISQELGSCQEGNRVSDSGLKLPSTPNIPWDGARERSELPNKPILRIPPAECVCVCLQKGIWPQTFPQRRRNNRKSMLRAATVMLYLWRQRWWNVKLSCLYLIQWRSTADQLKNKH